MRLRVSVKRGEDDGEDFVHILTDEMKDVLVAPIVQGALGNLKVWALDAARNLQEEGSLNLDKLFWLCHVQNLFYFVQEHNFLGAVGFGPEPQQTRDHGVCQARILLQELYNAVRQLGVVEREGLRLMQWQ